MKCYIVLHVVTLSSVRLFSITGDFHFDCIVLSSYPFLNPRLLTDLSPLSFLIRSSRLVPNMLEVKIVREEG